MSAPTRKREDLTDTIQETCIARMRSLGMAPADVWLALGPDDDTRNARCSATHVEQYLTRRASIGSHKLQHVMRALKLELKPVE